MKKKIELASFFQNIYIEHPRIRLTPRVALRNDYFDVFNEPGNLGLKKVLIYEKLKNS